MSIAVGAIAGVVFRPKQWPEAVWAGVGAVLLVSCGLLPIVKAWSAIAKGTDIYLFLARFIANAASFVLPISNPANLVAYSKNLPALLPWLSLFLVPSILSITAGKASPSAHGSS